MRRRRRRRRRSDMTIRVCEYMFVRTYEMDACMKAHVYIHIVFHAVRCTFKMSHDPRCTQKRCFFSLQLEIEG